jgi:catechol 2,3-dioxygenase
MHELPRVSLRHVGIYVTDFDMMVDFYVRLFGFSISDLEKADNRKIAFLTCDPNAHHTFVISGGRAKDSPSTVNQISFYVDTLADVRRYWQALGNEPGIGRKYATTHGNAWSVYFLDPEGNRVEVYTDTPWHIPQPSGTDIDLAQSDDEIYRQTEALVRAKPGFEPFADWRVKTAKKMGLTDFRITS